MYVCMYENNKPPNAVRVSVECHTYWHLLYQNVLLTISFCKKYLHQPDSNDYDD